MADTKYITEEYLDRRLDERLGKLEQNILDALGVYAKQVDDRFEGIDDRFDGIDKRFDGIDKRLDSMDMRLFKVEQKLEQHDEEFRKLHKAYDHLVKTVDEFIARIDAYETEQAARDHKIERLERWIEQIADATGVKLST
jgi:chromosome segregation ATPase